MANIIGKLSKFKVVVLNGDVLTAQIRDTFASHYLGRLNSDNIPTTATITLNGESTSITAKINDWIVLQTKSDAFIWNGTEWTSFGGTSDIPTTLAELTDDATHRTVSDTEKSAWNNKQSAITSSNKLSSDLVDDTNNTHKFATAAQLDQIAANASDISSLQEQVGYAISELEGVL